MEARYLDFDPVLIPLMALVENSGEKLARFRRLILARDAYDLSLLAEHVRGQLPSLCEVLLYQVYFDVVVDRRGNSSLSPGFRVPRSWCWGGDRRRRSRLSHGGTARLCGDASCG